MQWNLHWKSNSEFNHPLKNKTKTSNRNLSTSQPYSSMFLLFISSNHCLIPKLAIPSLAIINLNDKSIQTPIKYFHTFNYINNLRISPHTWIVEFYATVNISSFKTKNVHRNEKQCFRWEK